MDRAVWHKSAHRCDSCGHRFSATSARLQMVPAICALILLMLGLGFGFSSFVDLDDVEAELASETRSEPQEPAAPREIDYSKMGLPLGLLESAEAGNAGAQYRLAMTLVREYEHTKAGLLLRKSYEWLQSAADNEHVAAQAELADWYLAGRGVVQDFSEAAKWYQRAAESGSARAMYGLGEMVRTGWGGDLELVDAYVWLNLAAARGESRAVESRRQVIERLSAEQLAEAQRKSRELDESVPNVVIQ